MKQTIKQWTLSGLAIIAALSFGGISISAQTTMNAKEMKKQQQGRAQRSSGSDESFPQNYERAGEGNSARTA